MGILDSRNPPRAERIARRAIAALAYGGTALVCLAVMSSFLWIWLPSEEWQAEARKSRAASGEYRRLEAWFYEHHDLTQYRFNLAKDAPSWVDPTYRAAQPLQDRYKDLIERWSALVMRICSVIILLAPLAAWLIWVVGARRRCRILASREFRQDLATTFLHPEEVLRPAMLQSQRVALHPFAVMAPIMVLMIIAMPFVGEAPWVNAPWPSGGQYTEGILESLSLTGVAAAGYVLTMVFVVRFLAPFLALNGFLIRCLPRTTPDAPSLRRRVRLSLVLVLLALGWAIFFLLAETSLGTVAYWSLRCMLRPDVLLWNWVPFEKSVAFLEGIPEVEGVRVAVASAVLLFLPPWALRRQWTAVCREYYRFE